MGLYYINYYRRFYSALVIFICYCFDGDNFAGVGGGESLEWE